MAKYAWRANKSNKAATKQQIRYLQILLSRTEPDQSKVATCLGDLDMNSAANLIDALKKQRRR